MSIFNQFKYTVALTPEEQTVESNQDAVQMFKMDDYG